jgi:hypothetical protein
MASPAYALPSPQSFSLIEESLRRAGLIENALKQGRRDGA